MEFDVGARLKQIREQHGLSQRALAQRAGVTNGTISLIEQNRSSPSVSSLRKVLQGIPMTLAEFFSSDDLPPPEQIFFKGDELIELADELKGTVGRISFRQVGDLRSRNLQILHERYAPGADTGRTMLQHEGEEGGIVIKGQIELTVGDRKQLLGPGDAYFFDSRVTHRFRNIGEEECELISACTPPYL
ncbi:cupin domain-containing protein [Azospirillum sp. CT11-132]|jgi:transcriptional regulator with XRE-family HTH domain|uniref:cupin domain-containing protein n=1 Tax=unclassified Azospirillum TaxID=2630922 RepID=UPI000D607C98|nr:MULTISPECIES: cupin domain-containing protein [unclassified Azospirillum]MCM8737208.1 cupin domain-containing protein [Azospirillum sp. A1-3]PWC59617.1 XRE family transcriptional regulator [Azospirillum sp. TSH20]PWC65677.1 XRE family transcriptional regulator [Azospirillum sp. TSH7]PWC94915.1 XRE family transcriptional regulator [Azospirillum sp. TSO5]QCG95224.1 cupin domain-containing protein [Azospirillum sp. TSA2s]